MFTAIQDPSSAVPFPADLRRLAAQQMAKDPERYRALRGMPQAGYERHVELLGRPVVVGDPPATQGGMEALTVGSSSRLPACGLAVW